MRTLASIVMTVAIAAAVSSGARYVRQDAQPPDATDAAALADFAQRVHEYADLHREVRACVGAVRISSDAAQIRQDIDALGDAIRHTRAGAVRGEFFTPAIAAALRRTIVRTAGTRIEEVVAIAADDVPEIELPEVNGRWPSDAFPTLPATLLRGLPVLPEELEYRLIGRHLVLRDRDADVILDILVDAIPPLT